MDDSLLILASASPRRQHLLEQAGIPFEVIPARVDEWEAADADPEELVAHNALLKAQSVARANPQRPVLGADTTVSLGDKVLNKPASLNEAREMLKTLSGRRHSVFTAISLVWSDRGVTIGDVVESGVWFRNLDDDAIDNYFRIVNPLDKAGAYGIQEGRDLIIERYEGSLTNIMGLPMERLRARLEQIFSPQYRTD